MSIPAAHQVPALPSQISAPIVDKSTGMVTSQERQWKEKLFSFVSGMARLIPCNCTNVGNVYTLSAIPLVTQFCDYDGFPFVASATSTGLVTMTLVASASSGGGTQTIGTVNAYKTNGSAQATTGDITNGLFYVAYFVDSLNSGQGGFVIK